MDTLITTRFKVLLGAVLTLGISHANAGSENFPCLIEASEEVEIGTPVTGIIQSITVERSDEVKKGQILARLKSAVERKSVDLAALRATDNAEIEAATAAMEHARREKTRAITLFEKNLVSKQFLDKAVTEYSLAVQKVEQARSNVGQARKELQLAKAQLGQRIIRSPIDGIVSDRYMAPGQRVQEAPIMKIVTIDPLRVEVIMPATYYNRLKKGQPLAIKPDLPGYSSRTARILIIDRIIDAASNTFRVTLELPNPDKMIPAGARCTAQLAAPAPIKKNRTDAVNPEQQAAATVEITADTTAPRKEPPKTVTFIVDDKEYDPSSNPFIQ
jgi:RND family efflux transporter MFP subunit